MKLKMYSPTGRVVNKPPVTSIPESSLFLLYYPEFNDLSPKFRLEALSAYMDNIYSEYRYDQIFTLDVRSFLSGLENFIREKNINIDYLLLSAVFTESEIPSEFVASNEKRIENLPENTKKENGSKYKNAYKPGYNPKKRKKPDIDNDYRISYKPRPY